LLQNLEQLIRSSPAPEVAANRLDRLCADPAALREIERLSPELLRGLIAIISTSNFLFHFLIRHPESIMQIGLQSNPGDGDAATVGDFKALRRYKYEELLKITWMDISQSGNYTRVLKALSSLAETVIRRALLLALDQDNYRLVMHSLAVMALGKLGAAELNFSSDIDLVYVSVNPEKYQGDYQDLQNTQLEGIRRLNSTLEETTEEGFLYRVDMKLRPWGASGPMIMAIDDTEHYYEASSEPWERFAWLRARCIAGYGALGADMKQRMQPFVFMRSLSTDDLERFIEIKNDMSKARKRKGYWNVKVGEGGIRDIEFFIQMLQIVNASKHDSLQTTNTLEALAGLDRSGLISHEEAQQLREAYLYLRRLENRLQMIDEIQTHNLPDTREQRLLLARSLTTEGGADDEILGNFERELFINQSIAKRYFERILPGK